MMYSWCVAHLVRLSDRKGSKITSGTGPAIAIVGGSPPLMQHLAAVVHFNSRRPPGAEAVKVAARAADPTRPP